MFQDEASEAEPFQDECSEPGGGTLAVTCVFVVIGVVIVLVGVDIDVVLALCYCRDRRWR